MRMQQTHKILLRKINFIKRDQLFFRRMDGAFIWCEVVVLMLSETLCATLSLVSQYWYAVVFSLSLGVQLGHKLSIAIHCDCSSLTMHRVDMPIMIEVFSFKDLLAERDTLLFAGAI